MQDENPLMTTEEVAQFLDFPVSTLVKWRRIRMLRERIDGVDPASPGGSVRDALEEEIESIKGIKMSGPPFIRMGARKIRYKKSDVLAWAEDPT
jgi:hypothetical protein